MGKLKITEKMQELSQGSENRSAIARLRDIFEDIEIALSAGVKREAIWETLKKEGYEMPLKTFESAIYRIKNEREKQTNHTAPARPLKEGVASTAFEAPTAKTGFHQVVEQLAEQNSNTDPRRNT